jgi:tetratricopeptide (TPR) repeat protein
MASSSPWRVGIIRVVPFAAVMAIVLWPWGGWTQAQAPTDTVFELPGVFRIALPPGWQKTKVIDDRLTVAAFSSKDLTLEVMRDPSRTPVEQYVQTIPERRLRVEADEYPGAYSPVEVMSNPGSYEVEVSHHFDEYTSIGGLPALWVRNNLEYTKPPAETHAARVWSVLILSPGEYWSLELRGDDRSWPAGDGDLRRMVRSFQLLEPTLTHVKAAIPAEAWQQVPSALPQGSCQFAGIDSGVGTVVPCGSEVTERSQGGKDAADKGEPIGLERLALDTSAVLSLYHYSFNLSGDEFIQEQEKGLAGEVKAEKVSGKSMSYKRNDKREITIDGISGTRIWATARDKKTHGDVSLQLLTVSTGTDHFSIVFSSGTDFAHDHSDEIEKIFTSVHLFPLRPESSLASIQLKSANSKTGDLFAGVDVGAALDLLDDSLKVDLNAALSGCNTHPDHPPTSAQLERAREDVRLFNDSNSHLRLGDLLRSSGDCAGGSTEFKAAVQINPRNAEADREVAKVYMPIMTQALEETMADRGSYPSFVPEEHGDVDHAIAAWERVLAYGANGNKDDLAHAELASLYSLNGKTPFALFHRDNTYDDTNKVHRSKDEIAAADKVYEKTATELVAAEGALKDDPSHQNRLHYAEAELNYGDIASAGTQCRLVYRIDPRDLRAMACLARVADARGEQEAIIGFVKEWLAISPNAPEAYLWLARAFQWDPADFKKAAESYKAVIDNAGKAQVSTSMMQEARVYWPHSYELAGLWQEAADAYEANVHDSPADGETLNAAAWFYATTKSKLRNPAKALEFANRAVAAAPADANIIDTLAEAYFINGRIDLAVATEQKALTLAPGREDLQTQMKKFKDAQQAKPAKKPPQQHPPVPQHPK